MNDQRIREHTEVVTTNESCAFEYVCFFIVLLPVVVMSSFNHPIGDDYWLSAMVRNEGFAEAFQKVYTHISARYTAISLMSINPLVTGDVWAYKVIPVIFLVFFFFSVYGLARSLITQKSTVVRRSISLISLGIVTTYVATMPGIGEGLFWLSSACVYQLGIVLSLLWLRLLVRWYYHDRRSDMALLSSSVLFVLMCGTNEIIALYAVVTVFTIGMTMLITRRRMDKWIGIHNGLALMIIALVFYSPSLQLRYFNNTDSGVTVVQSASRAAEYSAYHLLKVSAHPFTWSGVLLMLPHLYRVKTHTIFSQRSIKPMVLASIMILLVLTTEFIPIHLTSNNIPPLRITNLSTFIFFGALFLFSLQPHGLTMRMKTYVTKIMAVALLIVGFILPNNISIAAREVVSGKGLAYDREMNNRFRQLSACTSDTCYVPKLQHLPSTVRYSPHDDLQHVEKYFKCKIVVR